jgi:hypothetical protein
LGFVDLFGIGRIVVVSISCVVFISEKLAQAGHAVFGIEVEMRDAVNRLCRSL